MKLALKRIFAILVIGVGLFHAGMTALYLSPSNLVKLSIDPWVHAYMGPLFYQDWHLFSPNPGFSSFEFWIRCKVMGKEWTQWSDPFRDLQLAHYHNRMTGKGKLLYVYRGIATNIYDRYEVELNECENEKEKDCGRSVILARVKKSPVYEVARRFAGDYCASVLKTEPQYTIHEIKVVNLFPKKYSARNDTAKWGQVIERSFGQGGGYKRADKI